MPNATPTTAAPPRLTLRVGLSTPQGATADAPDDDRPRPARAATDPTPHGHGLVVAGEGEGEVAGLPPHSSASRARAAECFELQVLPPVSVHIHDGKPATAMTGSTTDDAESGRGLQIVRAVPDNFTVEDIDGDGKVVHAVFDAPQEPSAPMQ